MTHKSSLLLPALALALLGCVPRLAAQSAPSFVTLHSFGSFDGFEPTNGLVQGNDGNFYGTTTYGGNNGIYGCVYEVTSAGVESVIAGFTGSNGEYPVAPLTLGKDGDFYGTTESGGTRGNGTVFKLTSAGVLTTLHSFTRVDDNGRNQDGANIQSGLVQGRDGNFYGMAAGGGTSGQGTFFKITPSGTFTTLHNFVFSDFEYSHGTLVEGSDGNFYGTTADASGSPTSSGGQVFKITPDGTFTSLHSFSALDGNEENGDGATPLAGLTLGKDGNFYGTTSEGGTGANGTVFKITPAGVLTTLHSFSALDGNDENTDGANPHAGVIQGSDGNFYGTAYYGGADGNGTVFRMTPAGAVTTLHSFSALDGNNDNTDGENPHAPLLQGRDGNFYGTAAGGGASGAGTVFEIEVTPHITSAATAAATAGKAFSYQITANHGPTSYGVQGLPSGLTVNPSTGLISGTPKAAGTVDLTLNAYNNFGKGSAPLTLTILGTPVINSSTTVTATEGSAFSYQITASNSPTSFGVQGLPAGFTVNTKTGLIFGTPKGAGTATLTLNAYNSVGKGSATLTLTIKAAPPVVTSATTATGTVGKAFSYQVTASNQPTSFGVQGLPAGFSVDTRTGLLTGTPTTAGTVKLTLNAYNSVGKGSGPLTLTITK